MSDRRQTWFAAGLVGLFVLLWLLYEPPPVKGLPDSTVATLDSLEGTRGVFDSVVTNTLAMSDQLAAQAQRLRTALATAQRQASQARLRADSLMALRATSADSAGWLAHDARLAEAQALRLALDTALVAIDTLTASRDSARSVAGLALDRLAVVEAQIPVLRATVTRLQRQAGRKLTDYVMLGCGLGIRGADCVAGVRIPLGR